MARQVFEWAPSRITIHDSERVTISELLEKQPLASTLPGEIWTALKNIAGKAYASKMFTRLRAGERDLILVLVDPRSLKRWSSYGWPIATKDDPSVKRFREAMRLGAIFPPIIIDSCRRILFEGRHRTGAAFYEGFLIWAVDVCDLLPVD